MAQVIAFSCGGFVVHKALGKRLSAWYDVDNPSLVHYRIQYLLHGYTV